MRTFFSSLEMQSQKKTVESNMVPFSLNPAPPLCFQKVTFYVMVGNLLTASLVRDFNPLKSRQKVRDFEPDIE